MNYLMWILVGFIFSKVIKDRFRGWWLQYNFLTSAALDAGLALCTIVIFLCLNLVSFQSTLPPVIHAFCRFVSASIAGGESLFCITTV